MQLVCIHINSSTYFTLHFEPSVHQGFLKIVLFRKSVCMCACVFTPEGITTTSGVMWCDMDPIYIYIYGAEVLMVENKQQYTA